MEHSTFLLWIYLSLFLNSLTRLFPGVSFLSARHEFNKSSKTFYRLSGAVKFSPSPRRNLFKALQG
ncbi:hypothetical protein KC19_9G058000 [Ceratodon purpureus]|uniref:Uncharacterized protein n=1 Tax=Ceratodon purpureus TaxID=3225 RepID=A0A8T0GQZ3_CERPU|nr:hypothetical protein KC19_9G058000 [Ceratodon purpureus]